MSWTKWMQQINLRQLKISKPNVNSLNIKKYFKMTDEIYKNSNKSVQNYAENMKTFYKDVYKNINGVCYKINHSEGNNNGVQMKSYDLNDIKDKIKNLKFKENINLRNLMLILDLFHGNIGKFLLRALFYAILSKRSSDIEDIRCTINKTLQKHNIIKEITTEQFQIYIHIIFFIAELSYDSDSVGLTAIKINPEQPEQCDFKDLNDKSVENALVNKDEPVHVKDFKDNYHKANKAEFEYIYFTSIMDNKSEFNQDLSDEHKPNNPLPAGKTKHVEDIILNGENHDQEFKTSNKYVEAVKNCVNINQFYTIVFGARFAALIMQYCFKSFLNNKILNKPDDLSSPNENDMWLLKKLSLLTRLFMLIFFLTFYLTR